MSKHQCLLRYGRFSCYLCSRCSVWFPCMLTKLSALFLIGSVHSFKNSFYFYHLTGMRSLCMALTPLCYWSYWNTLKSFEWPHSQNSRGLKFQGSCRPVDWASISHLRLTQSLVHKWTIQGHIKTLAYSDPGNDLQVLQQQRIPARRFKKNFSNST